MLAHEKEHITSGEEFYQRYLSGDEDAFTDLVALYEHELFFFLNGIVRDSHEAKHIMIDAFANLAISGGGFMGRSSIKTYLFTIAKNLAIKYLKMRNKEQHITFEEIQEAIPDDKDSPDKIYERMENHRKLHDAMMELKEDYRVVLVLLYFEDMSYIEAGQVMNKNVKQIGDLAYRAKAALKKRLPIG